MKLTQAYGSSLIESYCFGLQILIKSENGRPLVLVKRDTGKYEKVDDIKKIESASIKSMSVIKSSSDAKITFGEYGDTSHGVILIELK